MKLRIDEEGYPCFTETRITDEGVGKQVLENLNKDDKYLWKTSINETDYVVEVFDSPYVVQNVLEPKSPFDGQLELQLAYGVVFKANSKKWQLDEWDRFHGRACQSEIPFVLSRKAQAQLLQMAEEFDDDSFQIQDFKIKTPMMWEPKPNLESEYWNARYKTGDTPWDIEKAHPAFKDLMPRLKLSKCRVLVLGCGNGHDAALLAKNGHHVTAVDGSLSALENAKKNYSSLNIEWIHADIFNLPAEYNQAFDLVLEHTCFCAVSPDLRQDLVKVWNRCLVPTGYLLGVFFVMDKPDGPPFGGTEWEYRQRLKDRFHFLFWGRAGDPESLSIAGRSGKELVVFAQKKD